MVRSTFLALVAVALFSTAHLSAANADPARAGAPQVTAPAPIAALAADPFAAPAPLLPRFLAGPGIDTATAFCPSIPIDCCTLKRIGQCLICTVENPSCA